MKTRSLHPARLRTKILLLLGATVLALFSGELALRTIVAIKAQQWFVMWSPVVRNRSIEIPHPIFNHVLKPGAEMVATSYPAGLEYCVFQRASYQGLNDDPVPAEKLPDELRIVVLGDSFVEARQVYRKNNFCKQLERRLSQMVGRPVRVINAGVSTYSPILEYLYYTQHIRQFKPDIVVQMFFANDVFDDIRYTGSPSNGAKFDEMLRPIAVPTNTLWMVLPTMTQPQIKAEEDYHVKVIKLSMKSDRGWWINHSYMLDYLDTTYSLQILKRHYPTRPRSLQFYILDRDPALKRLQQRGWQLTTRYIKLLHEAVSADGATMLLTSAPVAAQVYSRASEDHYLIDGPPTLDDQVQLKRVADELGIKFIDMIRPLRAAGNGLYFPHDGHWTTKGHAVVADAILPELLKLIQQ
jgi:lysophospholipase L1-like esterase